MGREIERLLVDRGHSVGMIVDVNNGKDLRSDKLSKIDVALEFTTPVTAFDNIERCLKCGVPIVCGTTGWYDRLEEARSLCRTLGGGLFTASNFSIGVNLLFDINTRLAKLMNSFEQFDVSISETHHIHKLDAPSGTAITLAEEIASELNRKNGWTLSPEHDTEKVEITSIREGEIAGIHDVVWRSEDEVIHLSHETLSRRSLAFGAILAAEFMVSHKGVYTMQDILNQ